MRNATDTAVAGVRVVQERPSPLVWKLNTKHDCEVLVPTSSRKARISKGQMHVITEKQNFNGKR